MMYIIRQTDKDANDRRAKHEGFHEEPHAYTWYIGAARPTKDQIPFEDVVEVYADYQELEYVRKNYVNLPVASNLSGNTWRGEFAQFIYDHLPVAKRTGDETAHYR